MCMSDCQRRLSHTYTRDTYLWLSVCACMIANAMVTYHMHM